MFGLLLTFGKTFWKQILGLVLVLALLAFAWWAVASTLSSAEDRGYQRGKAEVAAAYAKQKQAEVEKLTEMVNTLVTESQAGAARVEAAGKRATATNAKILEVITATNKPLTKPDCTFTDDFMQSWDQLRRAK
jgi:hypothetical protein